MRGADSAVRRATFDAQLERARDEMRRAKIPRFFAEPWPHRLLWACGVRARPPLFTSRAVNATVAGTIHAVVMACIFGALGAGSDMGWELCVLLAAVCGAISAWPPAAAAFDVARGASLPIWEDLARPQAPNDESDP